LVFGPEVIVKDLESRNGVFVDDIRVQVQKGVKHGQIIRFGGIEARLKLHENLHDGSSVYSAMEDLSRFESQKRADEKGEGASPQSYILEPTKTNDSCQATEVATVPEVPVPDDTGHLKETEPLPESKGLDIPAKWLYGRVILIVALLIGWLIRK
jgi:hypothetical protein